MILEELRGIDGFKLYTPKGNSFTYHEIEMLDLTLEEVKDTPKKLYAWRAGVNIFFTSDERAKLSGMRAPEFDITYGDDK